MISITSIYAEIFAIYDPLLFRNTFLSLPYVKNERFTIKFNFEFKFEINALCILHGECVKLLV